MLISGIDRVQFFNNFEDKKDLIKLVYFCFQVDEDVNLFEPPLIINSCENTWRANKETIEVLPISNHEEADKK